MITNLFTDVYDDGNATIAMVRRAALEECSGETCLIGPVLQQCVARAVERYRESRVTAFVPLLALRQVRECIRLGACPELPG